MVQPPPDVAVRPFDTPREDPASGVLRFAAVIPALNEEGAIGATLEQTLAAREVVTAETSVESMEVVFVNDGSTDGTQAIADRFPDVTKVRFPENRGYGAAIKAGFMATDAELVGFMDADGTCNPRFFARLIQRLEETNADVVLGARLEPGNEMPRVRRLGNWMFARLVGIVSGKPLTDCASGMRVIRRSSLRKMVPLPDGLHFTPAMSCLALLDPRLRIEEVPMPYKERVGRSKLRVFKDGIKFLGIILFAASCFNPIRVLLALGFLFGLLGAALCHVAHRLGADAADLVVLAGAFVFVFLQSAFIGMLCHQLTYMLIRPRTPPGRTERVLQRVFKARPMVLTGAALGGVGILLWAGGLLTSGEWRSQFLLAAAVCTVLGGWSALGGIILRVIWAVGQRQTAEREDPFAPMGAGARRPEADSARLDAAATAQ